MKSILISGSPVKVQTSQVLNIKSVQIYIQKGIGK
jgi:hypothetical protein